MKHEIDVFVKLSSYPTTIRDTIKVEVDDDSDDIDILREKEEAAREWALNHIEWNFENK